MRNVIRPILFASTAALLPALASGTPAAGAIATPDCLAFASNLDAENAEMYALKITQSAAERTNDWLWDIREKGETRSDSQADLNPAGSTWAIGDVWALPQTANDMAFAFVTLADGTILVDSNDGSAVSWEAATLQTIGNSLPAGADAGYGLDIPGTATQFGVELRPGVPTQYPIRATPSGSATAGSVNIAFAPLAEVNPNFDVPGCTFGGNGFNPRAGLTNIGAIIGYNVYRVPGTAGAPPTRAAFDAALRTDNDGDGGWVYFIDLRTFDVTLPDTTPANDGTDAPSDTAVTDLAGLQNPDGRMYSGDETLILQDAANRAGVSRARALELAPLAGQGYWYRIQPVVFGTVGAFSSADFTSNSVFPGDHRIDVDGDGEFDAVSLDSVVGTHNSAEFISPQAEAENGSQAGLGLTNGGMPLLSDAIFVDAAAALPALGQVRLTGSVTGNEVNVELATGLERGNVLGYNVYRVSGDSRVRVNEQPILAQGSESNVYTLVDTATRARGARTVDYMVETVFSDGTTSTMAGPFTVSLDQQPVRRRR